MEKECTRCGVTYETDTPGRSKFCGSACYNIARVGKPRLSYRRRIVKKCVACGTEFETGGRAGSRDQEFCSVNCSLKARVRTPSSEIHNLTVAQAAYIAGLVDGEGSFVCFMRRDSISVRLTIANTFMPVLEWVVATTGAGSIVQQRHDDLRHKQGNQWTVNAETAGAIIRQIQPYLIIKPRQAAHALDVLAQLNDPATKSDRSWQLTACEAMRAMNKRGRPVAQE